MAAFPDNAKHRDDRALSAEEAERLAEYVAQVGLVDLPLALGLRAAAEESDQPRLAGVLHELADRIDQGRSLAEALAASADRLPRYLGGMIAASAATGQLGLAMAELVQHQRAARELRRDRVAGLAYPLVIGCLAALFVVGLITVGGECFEKIFRDFGTKLPLITDLFLWCRHEGLGWAAGGAVALVGIAWLIRCCAGRAAWDRLLGTLPVVGPIWHWSGLMEWYGLLSVLVRFRVPLPESLRMCAEGVSNADVAGLSLAVAEGVARGRGLSQAMSMRPLPASLAPLIRWGEETGDLAEALRTAREMLEDRVRIRTRWVLLLLPPLLFLAIGCAVLFMVGALFMPLISLIGQF